MKYVLRFFAVIGVTILIALAGIIVALILIFKGPYTHIRAQATEYIENNISFASWIPSLMLSDEEYDEITAQIAEQNDAASGRYNETDVNETAEEAWEETQTAQTDATMEIMD